MKDTQMLFPVVVSIHEMGSIFFIATFKFFSMHKYYFYNFKII